MSDNPKPLTYGAAMRALEGSQAALADALAEITRLRAALKEYGGHKRPFRCIAAELAPMFGDADCTCGWAAELEDGDD